MGELKYDFTRPEVLFGHTDLLDTDLEKHEFDLNFAKVEEYSSIFEPEPVYHSLMNFPEEEEEALYAQEATDNVDDEDEASVEGEADDEDDFFRNRDSYRDTDQDNVYYLI